MLHDNHCIADISTMVCWLVVVLLEAFARVAGQMKDGESRGRAWELPADQRVSIIDSVNEYV